MFTTKKLRTKNFSSFNFEFFYFFMLFLKLPEALECIRWSGMFSKFKNKLSQDNHKEKKQNTRCITYLWAKTSISCMYINIQSTFQEEEKFIVRKCRAENARRCEHNLSFSLINELMKLPLRSLLTEKKKIWIMRMVCVFQAK